MTEQRLGDLGGDMEEERIILNIQDQKRFFANDMGDDKIDRYRGMDAGAVLVTLRQDIGSVNFDIAAFVPREEDDDEEDTEPKTTFYLATSQVTEAVKDRTSQLLVTSSSAATNSSATGGLPREVFENVKSVHTTTHEFLHHFWLAFLSGDEKRAKDISVKVNSLNNSLARIAAVGETAETVREEERVKRRKELHEEYKRTGIKPKKKDLEVGGGKKVVDEMLAPTVRSIERALERYKAAIEEADKANDV